MVADPLFLAHLAQFNDAAWLRAVDRPEPAIHPIDRAATRAWFHFNPLRLRRALDKAADPSAMADHIRLQGRWRLTGQREGSHWFLFGHRFWADVRVAVALRAASADAPGSLDLAAQVRAIAGEVVTVKRLDPSWLVGITAVALRTLQQAGLPQLEPAGVTGGDPLIGGDGIDPDRLLARRRRVSAGWFAFLRGGRRYWTITFDERSHVQSFPLIASQHLTTAAALDTRDYRRRDPRCTEGPIPVQCRSCSCGTCRVGVLSGAEQLSPVEPRERTTVAALGYLESDDAKPVIRLSCMAQAYGPVTLAIPTWNGQTGARPRRCASHA